MSAALDIALHPKQVAAYQSRATEILYGGAAGGGKSFFMRVAAILWCSMIPGLQVYLFRRTYDDLIKNHIEGSKGFRSLLAPWVLAGFADIVESEIRFWNGSKIYLCHCEHEKHRFKYQGAEIHVLLIDELTLFTDVIYRFLRTRVRMTAITLPAQFEGCFPRILCGSNPGNIGHAFVKSTFVMDGEHPAVPMALRQMPDEEGGMVRQYIPATLDDNPTMALDDPTYRARIRGMGNAALVKAFEKGDWNAVVGSYLEGVWDEDVHAIDPFPIPATWKVWRAMDWGFAKPYSVGWYAMDPDGCIYRWRELYGYGGKADLGSREEASAVAKKIKIIEQHDERMGYEYRLNPADSAIFANIGAQRSIGKIFKDAGVRWVECGKGPRSRVIGAQLLVELLKTGKFKVFKTCKHWIRTVPALMPDDNNPEDVNSKMEDHCFPADTLVLTNKGARRIDSIGDALVLNDAGEWVEPGNWRVIRRNAALVRVVYEDGTSVTCTPDHKFLTTENIYLPALDLTDKISYARTITCKSQLSAQPSKNSTACGITAAENTSSAKVCACTAPCGSTSMAQCPKVVTSTTRTRTGPTTSRATWNALLGRCMSRATAKVEVIGVMALLRQLKQRVSGTSQMPGVSGTASITKPTAKTCCMPSSPCSASNAAAASLAGPLQSSATQIAKPKTSASGIRVIRVEPAGRADTGCITVMERHNFALANGVIVSNCWDETRYAVGPIRRSPDGEQMSPDAEGSDYNIEDDGSHSMKVRT